MLRLVTVVVAEKKNRSQRLSRNAADGFVIIWRKIGPLFQLGARVPKGALLFSGLWVHATDQDSRDGSLCLLWHWPVRSSWRSQLGEPSALRICAASSEEASFAPPGESCTSRRLPPWARSAPTPGQASPTSKERTLNQFLWKWVGRVPRTMSQLRRPPTKPTLLTMLRPGPLDQVFIHLSTPWKGNRFSSSAWKELALTWARCVHGSVCQLRPRLSVAEFCTEPSREVRGEDLAAKNGFSLRTTRRAVLLVPLHWAGSSPEDGGEVVALHPFVCLGWLAAGTHGCGGERLLCTGDKSCSGLGSAAGEKPARLHQGAANPVVCMALSGRRLSRTILLKIPSQPQEA